MSVNITFDGQSYIIAETGEVGWGGNTTSYLVAIAGGCLQKTGGSFILSAETDFGASFGLQSLYYKSRTVNPAAAGILRLANNSDSVNWRNAANSADLPLATNASDQLTFNGVPLATSGGGTVNLGTINRLGHYAATGTEISELAAITASRALQSDANGLPIASSVTSAELAFVSGVTSALQTQLDGTVHLAGTETITGAKTFSLVTSFAAGSVGSAGVQFSDGSGFYKKGADNNSLSINSKDVIDITENDFRLQRTESATAFTIRAFNTANDAGTSARFIAGVGGGLADDAFYSAIITAGGSWSWGIDNSDSDRFKIAGGAILGTNDNLIIDLANGVSIKGTATNDAAASGFVGEEIRSAQPTNTNFPATNVFGDLTSISLPAGDWDVDVVGIGNSAASATTTGMEFGVSITAGNSSTGLVNGDNYIPDSFAALSTNEKRTNAIPGYRISLGSTTTVYLKFLATYSSGQPVATGRISARRRR